MIVNAFHYWLKGMYEAALKRHRTIVNELYPAGPERDRAWEIHKDFTDWVYGKRAN
jgi:hypothetical protein